MRARTAWQIADVRGPQVVVRRDAHLRRMLAAADTLAVTASVALAVALARSALTPTWAAVLTVPLVLTVAKLAGLYDRDEVVLRKTTLDEAPVLFQVATLCAFLIYLGHSFFFAGMFYASEALIMWLALATTLTLSRVATRRLVVRASAVERCLFIGDAASADAISQKLAQGGAIKAEVVARAQLEESGQWTSDSFAFEDLDELGVMARHLDIHRAIVAPRGADGEEMLDVLRTLKAIGIRVSVVPRLLEVAGSSVEFDDLHGMTVMGVRRFTLTRSSAMMKRALDLLGATVGLFLLAPLIALVAIAIKLESRGPVFFRQTRVGRHGSLFSMRKFRSMVDDAENLKAGLADRNEARDGLFKIAEDPRATRVGRLLRRTSLDELPQLINVLRGEMSLVGPRPLIQCEDERLCGWGRRRLELTPGMTGQWQLLGATRVPLQEMAAIDYLYVVNWSLWNDVKILIRTVSFMVARRGM